MKKTAKAQAIEDIKAELKKESKAFISYNIELNPIMDSIVNEYIKAQEKHTNTSRCLSAWSLH